VEDWNGLVWKAYMRNSPLDITKWQFKQDGYRMMVCLV